MKYTEDQQQFIEGVRDFLYDDFPRSEYISLQGPPGSGKTALISCLDKEFPDTKFEYVAYTGKACDNLMKKGIPARTIFSRFYSVDKNATELSFLLNPPEILLQYVIVIDEVSMISQEMFEELLSLGKKIIAVGDRNQLGPVKRELNKVLFNPDYELTTIHRQLETSGILRLANEYERTHVLPPYGQYSEDVTVIPRDRVTKDMILSVNQTICGTNSTREKWNSTIRRYRGKMDYLPMQGERVICCKNTPIEIDGRRIINGTTGIVVAVRSRGNKEMYLYFRPDWALEEQYSVIRINTENFMSGKFNNNIPNVYTFDFAYVVTVNKAQGSEWDRVLYIVDKEIPGDSFYRNVNTGITRAKERLILAY